MEQNYVIKNNETGLFIASDSGSGGYPYDTSIKHAKVFTKDSAKCYKDLFPKADWSLHTLLIDSEVTTW
jgi:hypothetical protein